MARQLIGLAALGEQERRPGHCLLGRTRIRLSAQLGTLAAAWQCCLEQTPDQAATRKPAKGKAKA